MCFNLENRTRLRLAFDSGSQRSYITNQSCKSLGLKPISSRVMTITAFGEEGKKQHCEVVALGVETWDGTKQEVRLLTVPIICEPLSGAATDKRVAKCEHLLGLELADSTDEEDLIEIDVLIGLDYYWEFILERLLEERDQLRCILL